MAKRILIADDEPNIVASLEFLMEQAGYEVRPRPTATRRWPAVGAFAPDLVLLDVMMPGRSGYEVCERIKGDPGDARHPRADAVGEGPRRRGCQGPRSRRGRLHHQAVLDARSRGEGPGAARRMNRRLVAAVASFSGAALAVVACALLVLGADLAPAERDAAAALLTPARIGLLVLFALALVGVLGALAWRLYDGTAAPAARLAAGRAADRDGESRPSRRGAGHCRTAGGGAQRERAGRGARRAAHRSRRQDRWRPVPTWSRSARGSRR